jgi:hypothetical protein
VVDSARQLSWSPGIEARSPLSAIVSRACCLRALLIDREPILTEHEPKYLLILTEREPKLASVGEPGLHGLRAATPRLVGNPSYSIILISSQLDACIPSSD